MNDKNFGVIDDFISHTADNGQIMFGSSEQGGDTVEVIPVFDDHGVRTGRFLIVVHQVHDGLTATANISGLELELIRDCATVILESHKSNE
jgi:hypothetical protein